MLVIVTACCGAVLPTATPPKSNPVGLIENNPRPRARTPICSSTPAKVGRRIVVTSPTPVGRNATVIVHLPEGASVAPLQVPPTRNPLAGL